MHGCGGIFPHHVVAQVDENQSDEFGDVENLDMAETGRGSTDAGKQRPNGDEDIAEETRASLLVREILDGRVDRAAKQENEGVGVEEGRKSPDPLPAQHSSGEAPIEALRDDNRREQDAHGGNDDDRRAQRGRDIGKAALHQQVDGSLGQRVTTQQSADDVPDLGVPLAPAEDGIDAFGERAQAEREDAQGPPQQVWRALGEIMRYDPAEKEHRKDRRQDWYVINHGVRGLNLKEVGRFYTQAAALSMK